MSSDTTNNPSWGPPPQPTSTPYAPPAGQWPTPPQAGQWPGSPPPVWYPQAAPVQQRGTNGLAIASLVLGIVWVWWLGSILAVIFGHVSLSQIRRSNGTQGGRGLAIAGLVLGWVGIATLTLVVIAAIANPGSNV
jgi:hypothetical protein